MLKLSVKSDGKLQRKIDALLRADIEFRLRVSEIVRTSAFSVEAYAKDMVPISTGALRRSITPTFLAGGLMAVIGSPLPYAARQEFDAKLDHSVRPAKTRKINTIAGRIGSIIKGTQQTNPGATWGFLRKALGIESPLFIARLRQLVGRYGEAMGA